MSRCAFLHTSIHFNHLTQQLLEFTCFNVSLRMTICGKADPKDSHWLKIKVKTSSYIDKKGKKVGRRKELEDACIHHSPLQGHGTFLVMENCVSLLSHRPLSFIFGGPLQRKLSPS
ncbi:hypothetical protein TrispH2_002233 [Trichoplax sp. H2]|nr:hypothetical protein TrispH2_002233 [Trichoplax sp. H2]|eukprot:RDD45745.1 hypothetical protein TrispH2_002233 [Trichoplax sp. H2]